MVLFKPDKGNFASPNDEILSQKILVSPPHNLTGTSIQTTEECDLLVTLELRYMFSTWEP